MTATITHGANVSFDVPTLYEDGTALPNEPLPVLVFNDLYSFPVAAAVAMPGARTEITVPAQFGCWYVTAWALYDNIAAQSAPSEKVCKVSSCGSSCHGG